VKLYLSSYRLGRDPGALLNSAARGNKAAVIQNAQDCWTDPAKHQSVFERECSDLETLGLSPVELDLRTFFGRPEDLERDIEQFAYFWVCGGNSFVLRRAFHLSGFDKLLLERARQSDGLTYAGYSAGACVMTPTLEGIHLADEPDANPAGYTGRVIWEGLGLYPFCIAPHYRSDHPETKLIDQSVEYFVEKKIPFVALRDGEAITFDTVTKQSVTSRAVERGIP
jgi:dipeptidase E